MAIQCPTCSRVNPASATYCHHDGRALTASGQNGAWWARSQSFPSPFTFSDGERCANFDQLALACDHRWSEARGFLADGIWCSFFQRIGRLDLAQAAAHAAREPDQDIGLASLLERLPTEALRKPTLSLLSPTEDLGTLEPGRDHKFELVISNKGGLILSGQVVTDCDWLFFGDRHGDVSRKLFQTRDNYTLVVRVVGSRLRAGHKPLEGQIVIETSGGTTAVTVKAKVPVRPFPAGQHPGNVLLGCRSPREIVTRAKAHAKEAAPLFEDGAVEAWYASNGWTYPVQGVHAKGKGAVQQYFEALGLMKPPVLEVSTQRIAVRGRAGERLTETVTVSTQESKFVNADAHSDRPWLKVQPAKSQGNRVAIPLVIEVPPAAGQSLTGNLTVQGNGQQRFVVPVTLTVESGAMEKKEEPVVGPVSPRVWIFAGVGASLLFFVAVGSIALYLKRTRAAPPIDPKPPVVNVDPNPRPPVPVVAEAWWDGIPDQKLAAGAAELKAFVAADGKAIFDQIGVKADTDRFKAYEQLGEKLPALVREEKARATLARFLKECCVHEPSEHSISPLRRGLAALFPNENVPYRPEEKGGELDRAVFARQVVFAAMTHKPVRRERARGLANDLGRVFGLGLDTEAPPEAMEAATDKLLATRCYRNTVPTAGAAFDHALSVRAAVIEKFPRHLLPDVRHRVDADLIAIGLGKGEMGRWPKLEPIFKECLASENKDVALTLLAVYEHAEDDLARRMEGLMAARWKPAGNAKLSRAEKVATLRKIVTTDAAAAKAAMANRFTELRKRSDTTLEAASKPGPHSEIANLTHAVRLAHCSTLGSVLFDKDGDAERFEELLKRSPDGKKPDTPEEGKKPEKPKPSGGETVLELNQSVNGELKKEDNQDPARGTFRKAYLVALQKGQSYTIEVRSTDFNPYVRLETSLGKQVSSASAGGGNASAKLPYTPTTEGTYRLIATTVVKGATGSFTVQVQQAGGGGPGGGVPAAGFPPVPFPPPRVFRVFRFFPVPPAFPSMPEQPKAAPKAAVVDDSQVSKTDLTALAGAQRNARVIAFNNLATNLPNDLRPGPAEKIARYLLVTIATDSEIDDIAAKLPSLANCRQLLAALADILAGSEKLVQSRAEAVIGGILGQRLRFAKDEDWRGECRKLLLRQALDLTTVSPEAAAADMAADFLRDLYKIQGLAFGLESDEFLGRTQPTQVLEDLIKHVTAKVKKKDEYLEQLERRMKVARFTADNDLEHMVLLQRMWMRVLCAHLEETMPAQARAIQKVHQDLTAGDRDCRNVFDQLRFAEEKLLRVWTLAVNLPGPEERR